MSVHQEHYDGSPSISDILGRKVRHLRNIFIQDNVLFNGKKFFFFLIALVTSM